MKKNLLLLALLTACATKADVDALRMQVKTRTNALGVKLKAGVFGGIGFSSLEDNTDAEGKSILELHGIHNLKRSDSAEAEARRKIAKIDMLADESGDLIEMEASKSVLGSGVILADLYETSGLTLGTYIAAGYANISAESDKPLTHTKFASNGFVAAIGLKVAYEISEKTSVGIIYSFNRISGEFCIKVKGDSIDELYEQIDAQQKQQHHEALEVVKTKELKMKGCSNFFSAIGIYGEYEFMENITGFAMLNWLPSQSLNLEVAVENETNDTKKFFKNHKHDVRIGVVELKGGVIYRIL